MATEDQLEGRPTTPLDPPVVHGKTSPIPDHSICSKTPRHKDAHKEVTYTHRHDGAAGDEDQVIPI